jgi:small subunit ribosomal protein S16
MAVVIRLRNTGTKKKLKRRIVVTDKRHPRDGRFIEILGFWNPNTTPAELKVDLEKVKSWMEKGAKPTKTVRNLLKRAQKQKKK